MDNCRSNRLNFLRPEEYIVTSLSEYISKINDIRGREYYFRGEKRYYDNIVSSGLRDDTFHSQNKKPFYCLIEKFYREIGQRISDLDRNSFEVFSQHHGIPTNLIDITKSPLIALYFACELTSNINEDGYVYAINQNKTIDITERIEKKNRINSNIIDILKSDNLKDVKANSDMFVRLFKNNISLLKTYTQILYSEFHNGIYPLNSSEVDDISLVDLIDEYIEKRDKLSIVFEPGDSELHKFYNKHYTGGEEGLECASWDNKRMLINGYYILLKKYITIMSTYGGKLDWFNAIPPLTYSPITEFQRIKNQQGLFIHQGYEIESHFQVFNPIFVRQRILVDKIFVIKNKNKILDELDNLGINQKFVFYDFDSIANYIKNN